MSKRYRGRLRSALRRVVRFGCIPEERDSLYGQIEHIRAAGHRRQARALARQLAGVAVRVSSVEEAA